MAGALRSAVGHFSRCCLKNAASVSKFMPHSVLQNSLAVDSRLLLPSLLHTTSPQHGLMDFFEAKKNWGEENIKTGRPWRADELRIKSNSDLHKLWYVLLKERNMLMTMQHEYERQSELFPSPERIDKVEESMENVMSVVKERDEAYSLLETGTTGNRGGRRVKNFLGLSYYKKYSEHLVPAHMNKNHYLRHPRFVSPRIKKFVVIYRERQRQERNREEKRQRRRVQSLERNFPHLQGKL